MGTKIQKIKGKRLTIPIKLIVIMRLFEQYDGSDGQRRIANELKD